MEFGSVYKMNLRHELQPYGVDVIEIVPGSFESGMQNTERLIKMVDVVWYRASQKLHDEYGHNFNEKGILWYFYINLQDVIQLINVRQNYLMNVIVYMHFIIFSKNIYKSNTTEESGTRYDMGYRCLL